MIGYHINETVDLHIYVSAEGMPEEMRASDRHI